MTLSDRRVYAKLIVALAEDDRSEIVRLFHDEMGIRTKHNDSDIMYRLACFFNDRDTDDVMQGLNIQLFLEDMDRRDPIVTQNDEFVMVARLSILMRGMGNAFHLKLRTAKAWEQQARQFLQDHPEQ